jgi:uroporphyrin-III C-methyltransferase/precorrin-2 dehydrogenase/sirohydrochlorin ferrochelatase
VLARRIKTDIEERLRPDTGVLARIGREFRPAAAALPPGPTRRWFWSRYYDAVGPQALSEGGEDGVRAALGHLLRDALDARAEPGWVSIVGAGPGDPELLTLKARRALHEADLVIHDPRVSAGVLELARREATFVDAGAMPGGASRPRDDTNALMLDQASTGAHVVWLVSGDPAGSGYLDRQIDALDAAGIGFEIVPGIPAAATGVAEVIAPPARSRRQSGGRIPTLPDTARAAAQEWHRLVATGAISIGAHTESKEIN